jgi:hypothetical protein
MVYILTLRSSYKIDIKPHLPLHNGLCMHWDLHMEIAHSSLSFSNNTSTLDIVFLGTMVPTSGLLGQLPVTIKHKYIFFLVYTNTDM